MRDRQVIEQSPEVIHVPPAERDNRDETRVNRNRGLLAKSGEDDLLAIPLAQHDEPREVQLGISPHRLTDVLVGLVRLRGELDLPDDGPVRVGVESKVPNRRRVDAPEYRRRHGW